MESQGHPESKMLTVVFARCFPIGLLLLHHNVYGTSQKAEIP